MILETSALIALLRNEDEADDIEKCLVEATQPIFMSAASYLEAVIVTDRCGDAITSARLDTLLTQLRVIVVPVSFSQAQKGRELARTFGKGTGHPALLNFGDCFALALSMETGERLLYKGEDFRRAGVRNALDDFIAR